MAKGSWVGLFVFFLFLGNTSNNGRSSLSDYFKMSFCQTTGLSASPGCHRLSYLRSNWSPLTRKIIRGAH